MREIIVGTRESELAMIQTKWVIANLKKRHPGASFNIKHVQTTGDIEQHKALTDFTHDGIFTNEMEVALEKGTIDFAVHSLKDLPLKGSSNFEIVAQPVREDARDAFISRKAVRLADLPVGAVIGTSSARRSAQIKAVYPHLKTKSIRGAVEKRLAQVDAGDYDGIVLAVAGLNRLGKMDRITEYLPVEQFTPAAGQGTLAIQCRKNDLDIRMLLAGINDPRTTLASEIEREFVYTFDQTDREPIGVYATWQETEITLYTSFTTRDGRTSVHHTTRGNSKAEVLEEAVDKMRRSGAMHHIHQTNCRQRKSV